MAVNLYSAGAPYGLFNHLGKLYKTQSDINVSRGTTIPADVLNAITFFDTMAPVANLTQAYSTLPAVISNYASAPSSVQSSMATIGQNLIIGMAVNDAAQPDSQFKTAMTYMINQMITQGKTVNQSSVSITVTAAGGNTGNGAICKSTKRGDGLVHESMLAEAITGTFTSGGLQAGMALKGQAAASGPLGQDWPMGSGVSATLTSVDANSSSMITNGGMETWANQPNVPDNWTPQVATPGTTLFQTILEVQQIAITGTPTGGTYTISWVNAAGKLQTTTPLAFNANASTVQAALRALSGLGSVTVTQTGGSSPNYVFSITFNGLGGNPAQFTINDNTTGGAHTITPSTLTAGTPQVFAGSYACQFKSNGAELTELRSLIPATNLAPLTAYAISLWACGDAVPGAGVVTIDLYDGSAVINDAQGVPNSITFNANQLLNSTFKHLTALTGSECAFRMPAVVPPLVYLRIRISTAITNGVSMFIDNVGMTSMSAIYAGGPLLALFSGSVAWTTNDSFTITTTNNRAGVLREWCERNFNLSSLGLLLPTSGAPNIPDNVVS